MIDAWLPRGFALPDRAIVQSCIAEGAGWQVYGVAAGGRALVASSELWNRWLADSLIGPHTMSSFTFGALALNAISSGPDQILGPVVDCTSPNSRDEALAFAMSLKATREFVQDAGFQDAIYVEKISRLLPTYGVTSRSDDDVVLGHFLSGGASISAKAFRRLNQAVSWLGPANLELVVSAAGIDITEEFVHEKTTADSTDASSRGSRQLREDRALPDFELPGRPQLAAFFNEHVIDIVRNRARYSALGIGFPGAVVLQGPPGCGKTYAVDQLVAFLGWPSFQIDATSVASPYIHETSKKVADVFAKAMDSAPSVLVIDEMEAFLADRESGSGHHRVEEVAEFLRRIPEAIKNDVLIIGMTNRIEMIDPAIMRRGRFDHVLLVDFASEKEIHTLLEKLLGAIPGGAQIESGKIAAALAGRPLSDVAFVVREGARLSARAGFDHLDATSLAAALQSSPARAREGSEKRRIGFV